MLLIAEGPDLVGKTTLVENLTRKLEELGWKTEQRHCGPLKQDALTEYEVPLEHYQPGGELTILYDRHAWGEPVYGPLLRGKSRLDMAQLLHVELFLRARGALLVLLTQSLEELHRRYSRRHDDLITHNQLAQLVASYGWVRAQSVLDPPVLTDPSDSDVIQLIWVAGQLAEAAAPLSAYPSYIGGPRPEVLLLGDQPGKAAPGASTEHRACFVPHRSTSGYHLMRSLRETSLPPRVGIVNTLDVDFLELWHLLGQPSVVTLGEYASHRAASVGLRHARCDHPQWVRRFKHHEIYDYGKLLESAADSGRGDFTWRR